MSRTHLCVRSYYVFINGPWYSGLALWYSGTLIPWYLGTLVPWYLGTLAPVHLATKVPWYLGTSIPWYLGTRVLLTLRAQVAKGKHIARSAVLVLRVHDEEAALSIR